MDELLGALNPEPKAIVIESATKLALEWADQNRPIELDDLLKARSKIVQCYSGIMAETELENGVKSAVIKSATRLAHYWYAQNKSASLEQLIEAVSHIEKATRTDLNQP